ncbi:nitrite reductase (NAD(P)H) small subunit [Nocardioides sp.]|uniref:nitrite reductase (NAD(P)H) small subunit n=1 Tax=Nocardioides sp. TaxID=35761 RepID=UPI0026302742|nr:nitrite reductase (NAD(P)H) small subunit [Nocardioides sp.]
MLARGIIGTRGGTPFVASPMHKQAFDLRTGQCLDDAAVRVPTYEVRVDDGVVLVGPSQE